MAVEYDELADDGTNVRVRIPNAVAIQRAKLAAAQRGYTYPNDRAALDDFLVVHWAWEVDDA